MWPGLRPEHDSDESDVGNVDESDVGNVPRTKARARF